MNTALETASNPSAPLLPACTSVLATGGCGDKDAPLAARRAVQASSELAADLCRNYYSKTLLCVLARTQQDYADLLLHTHQYPHAFKRLQ